MKFLDFVVEDSVNADFGHLALTGRQTYYSQGYYGQDVIVAVVDTGVDKTHPQFEDRVVDVINYCSYGNGDDDNGHGTFCAGKIASKDFGVAPKAKIVSVKVLDGSGGGSSAKSVFEDICQALEDLKDWKDKKGNKINIVSMSLSASKKSVSASLTRRLEKAIKELNKNDISVICSAGNTGRKEDRIPACLSSPITVSAVDINELRPAKFVTLNDEVDVTQCGTNIYSTWLNGGYKVLSGTSMSTPVTAGIGALIACKHYQLFNERISDDLLYGMLKMNTKDIDVKGVDMKTGAGFCTLQPLVMDIYTKAGDKFWINNGVKKDLRIPVAVLPPGVTSIPIREINEEIGGHTTYDGRTGKARVRV